MNNCLVTKLKGSVQNDSLIKIGEFRIPVTSGTISVTDNDYENTHTAYAIGDLTINGGSSYTLKKGVNDLTLVGKGYISIPDFKYQIPFITAPIYCPDGFDSKYFSGLVNCNRVSFYGYTDKSELNDCVVTLEDLVKDFPNATEFTIGGRQLTGNLSSLAAVKNTLTGLTFSSANVGSVSTNNVEGTIADMGHLYKLASLNFLQACKNVKGSIESYVAARLKEQPNTAGSVTAVWLNSYGGITFEGKELTLKRSTTISWTSAGVITITQAD